MGLIENATSGPRLSVKFGKICWRSEGPAEGFIPTEVENPSTGATDIQYLRLFDAIEGYVTKIRWYDRKDNEGRQYLGFVLEIEDGEQKFELDLREGKSPYRTFVRLAENIDFTRPVRFSAKKKDKEVSFFASQDDVPIKHKYTKDHMGDCPPPVLKKRMGKETLDWGDTEEWLCERVKAVVIPRVEEAARSRPAFKSPQAALTQRLTDDEDAYEFADEIHDHPQATIGVDTAARLSANARPPANRPPARGDDDIPF